MSSSDDAEENARQDYFLQWKTDMPLLPIHLREATLIANAILKKCNFFGVRMIIQYDMKDEFANIHVGASKTAQATFGFPPSAFLDGLTSRERKAVLELGTSRDGWLAKNGMGQGIIITNRGLLDFPVRLFLSILATDYGLEISCSDDLKYGASGLDLREISSEFEWYPLKDKICAVVESEWLVSGSSKIAFTIPPAEADCRYSW